MPDGVGARRPKPPGLGIIDDDAQTRIEHFEHIRAVLLVERQQYLTVGLALELIALGYKLLAQLLKAVYLAVADGVAAVQLERLHSLRMQTHDGKPVEAEQAAPVST